jgi:HSP20 family molecular chaperone IbpA
MAALHPFGLVMGADPFRELRRIQAELNHISDFMAPAPVSGFPAVNLYAGQDGITVVAELPGVEKDDLRSRCTKTR